MTLSSIKQQCLRAAAAVAHSRQYTLVPNWELTSLPLVNHLRQLFRRYEIDCVLDVGGNMGQFATLLRTRVGFRGQIITFEPVSTYVKILLDMSAKDEQWQIFACALAREAGEMDINVTRSPGLNSFLTPNNDVVTDFWSDGDVTRVERVEVRTLDDVICSMGLDCQATGVYLKLDTQGFDLEVLSGAAASLSEIRGLQTEASVRAIYDGMPTYRQTLDVIESSGFSLSGLFPVSCDNDMRLIEFDCVAVNGRFEIERKRPA